MKADGWRFLMHFGGGCSRAYLTGRRISKKTGLLSEKGLNAPMLAPVSPLYISGWGGDLGYTVIDGEVMQPENAGFRDIAGIMNTKVEKAERRIAEIGPPRYFAFDILFYNGDDVRDKPLHERLKLLRHVIFEHFCGNPLVTQMDYVVKGKQEYYESLIAGGGEGIILKDLNAPYSSKAWVKVKRYHTLDVVVTGYTEGKGKYTGQVGAVEVSVFRDGELVKVGQVSGMTDEKRLEFTQKKDEFLGQVMEIKAQEFQKKALRHPRYQRMRPDSNDVDCTWEKMRSDLKKGTVE